MRYSVRPWHTQSGITSPLVSHGVLSAGLNQRCRDMHRCRARADGSLGLRRTSCLRPRPPSQQHWTHSISLTWRLVGRPRVLRNNLKSKYGQFPPIPSGPRAIECHGVQMNDHVNVNDETGTYVSFMNQSLTGKPNPNHDEVEAERY